MHKIECFSAFKSSDVLIYATTWITLVNIMLGEKSREQKTTFYMIPFILNVQKRENYRGERRFVVS